MKICCASCAHLATLGYNLHALEHNAIVLLKENEHPIVHSDRGCHYRWSGLRTCRNAGLTSCTFFLIANCMQKNHIPFYSPKINLPNLFLLKISMISMETPSVKTILAPTIIQGFLIFRTLIINVLEITSKKPLNKYNCKERCPHFCKTLPIGEFFKQPTT